MSEQTETEIDPLRVMDTLRVVETQDAYEEMKDEGQVEFRTLAIGDFIRPESWSRPRVIVAAEADSTGPVLFLADPDRNKPRRIDLEQFRARSGWLVYPNLGKLWRAYSPETVVLAMAPGVGGLVNKRLPFGGML